MDEMGTKKKKSGGRKSDGGSDGVSSEMEEQ
jgi:hypothetical protein